MLILSRDQRYRVPPTRLTCRVYSESSEAATVESGAPRLVLSRPDVDTYEAHRREEPQNMCRRSPAHSLVD
jgi:hypothetical protein